MAEDLFPTAQWLALGLIGLSGFLIALNTTLVLLVPQGIITDDATLEKLDSFVTIGETDLLEMDQNQTADVTVNAVSNPFAFIDSAFDAARLTGGILFDLLLGWSVVIDLLAKPYGMDAFGSVAKAIIGAIEGMGLLGFFIKVIASFRGGST